MNIMNRLAWRSLWKNRTRTIVTVIGIILSACALLIALYLLFNLFRLISIVSGGYGYFY